MGDSGSPYFVTTNVRKGPSLTKTFHEWEERSVLIAIGVDIIENDSVSMAGFLKNRAEKCRTIAAKINPEISLWLKRMAGIIKTP